MALVINVNTIQHNNINNLKIHLIFVLIWILVVVYKDQDNNFINMKVVRK